MYQNNLFVKNTVERKKIWKNVVFCFLICSCCTKNGQGTFSVQKTSRIPIFSFFHCMFYVCFLYVSCMIYVCFMYVLCMFYHVFMKNLPVSEQDSN